MSPPNCFICNKHRDLSAFAGIPIFEDRGLLLSHFPITEGAPATRGHLLVEPKRHILDLSEMNETEAEALGTFFVRATAALKKGLGAEHVYVFRINDQVPHLHFHLVPRYKGTPKEFWGIKMWDWSGLPKIGFDEIRTVSDRLAEAIH